ncbi:thermonuclease family protein [Lentzea sp. PSKA42]|uniref:Thermonuclease family protein n=1 Tax=Lentzea indica TaxID=2604800 RepID=A0ABX1F9N1_9PSEU|nr:thermonuclease family protein [Lentzea indica]NKE55569.1 thermonuclease family protein [Lentzea indica]
MLPNVYLMAAGVLAGAASSAYVVTVADRPRPVVFSHVVRVIDAETVEVREGDRVTVIRLVNVDAPAAGECLHEEARKRLSELLPEGTPVTVAKEGQFAAVSTQDGKLVNAALIADGLAVPTVNDARHLSQVKGANAEAAQKQKGLHSPEVPCTLPGQVRAITEAAAVVEAQPLKAGKTELTVAADTARTAIGLVDQLAKPGGLTWDAVAPVDQTVLLAKVTKAVPTLYRKEAELRNVVKGLR